MTKNNREKPLMLFSEVKMGLQIAAVLSAVTVPLAAGNHYLFCQQKAGKRPWKQTPRPGPGTAPQPFARGQLK